MLTFILKRKTAQIVSQGPLFSFSCKKIRKNTDRQEVGLEAAILLRQRNTSIGYINIVCMYVCMVITYSRVWINRVRLPILLVVS